MNQCFFNVFSSIDSERNLFIGLVILVYFECIIESVLLFSSYFLTAQEVNLFAFYWRPLEDKPQRYTAFLRPTTPAVGHFTRQYFLYFVL